MQELFDGGFTIAEIEVASDEGGEDASTSQGKSSAGIVVGAILAVLAVVGVAVYMLVKRNKQTGQAAPATNPVQARGQRKVGRPVTSTTNPAFAFPPNSRVGSGAGSAGSAGGAASSKIIAKCTRASPSGGHCKNNALRGTPFCNGHTCPVPGCTSGKSTKMETCPDHVHGTSVYTPPSSERK